MPKIVRQMTDAERWRALGMLDAGMSLRAERCISEGRTQRSPDSLRKREQGALCRTLKLKPLVTQLRELIAVCSEWCEAIPLSLQLC